ncbi:hypothetical protein DYI21_17090 [Thalassospira tepidiphila]|jgi:hypothetical protein|nr:hypothetical protein [Thalassospira tepidiphila]
MRVFNATSSRETRNLLIKLPALSPDALNKEDWDDGAKTLKLLTTKIDLSPFFFPLEYVLGIMLRYRDESLRKRLSARL